MVEQVTELLGCVGGSRAERKFLVDADALLPYINHVHEEWPLSPHLSLLMSTFNLNCLILGKSRYSIFDLEIERTESVYTLKERIKAARPNSVTIDANRLQLFLVSIPCDDDATSDDKFNQDLQYAYNTQQPLNNGMKLSIAFQQADLFEDHLHIIAKDPAVGGK